MKQTLLLLVCVFLSGINISQTNKGSFLLLRHYGINDPKSYILESDVYEKNAHKITIDSSKFEEVSPCKIVMVSQKNKQIEKYDVTDSSALILNGLETSLKEVDLRFGIRALLNFAQKIADSLLREGVYFITEPSLTTRESYELTFRGSLTFKPNINIDTLTSVDEQMKKEFYYGEFYQTFMEEFDYLGEKNIKTRLNKKNELEITFYLQDKNFDLKKLDKYKFSYSKQPSIKPRYYEIILLTKME